jgi:hypothetical protein
MSENYQSSVISRALRNQSVLVNCGLEQGLEGCGEPSHCVLASSSSVGNPRVSGCHDATRMRNSVNSNFSSVYKSFTARGWRGQVIGIAVFDFKTSISKIDHAATPNHMVTYFVLVQG